MPILYKKGWCIYMNVRLLFALLLIFSSVQNLSAADGYDDTAADAGYTQYDDTDEQDASSSGDDAAPANDADGGNTPDDTADADAGNDDSATQPEDLDNSDDGAGGDNTPDDSAGADDSSDNTNDGTDQTQTAAQTSNSDTTLTLQQAIATLENNNQRQELVNVLKSMVQVSVPQNQNFVFFNVFLLVKDGLKATLQELKNLGQGLAKLENWKVKFNFSNVWPKKSKDSVYVLYVVLGALAVQLLLGFLLKAALPPFFGKFQTQQTSRTLLKTSISLGGFFVVGYGIKTYFVTTPQTAMLIEHTLMVLFMLQFALMLLKYSVITGMLPVKPDYQKSLFRLLALAVFGWFIYVYLNGAQLLQVKKPTVSISLPLLKVLLAVGVLVVIWAVGRYKHVFDAMLFRPLPTSHRRLLQDMQQTFSNGLHYLILFAVVMTYLTWFVNYVDAYNYFKVQLLTTLAVLLVLSLTSHFMMSSSQYINTTLTSQQDFTHVTHRLVDVASYLGLGYIAYIWCVPLIAYAGVSTENASDKFMGIFLIVVITVILLHALNNFFNSALVKRGRYNKHLKTFLPIIDRLSKFFVLVVAVVLVLLELNVNMVPILASFSVIGLGVGLASKTIIEDFINGLFLIQENDFNIDDYVTVGNTSGTVENITLRKIHLRDTQGFLHFIPFSSVNTIINRSRDYNIEKIDIPLPSRFHLKRTVHILEDVGKQLFEDSNLTADMVSAPRFLGVSGFESNTQNSEEIIALMQFEIKTLPGKLNVVTGEFRKLVKLAFEEMERVM
jgi:small-conductance mechanosensitive channel